MPLTLAIDCAMRWINLGLGGEDNFSGSLSFNSGPKQSESLPDLVAKFLENHSVSLHDVETIAVTIGPGYYTGIRVGLSYASALAESLGVGLVPISTLEPLAYGFQETKTTIIPLLKARRGAVYCAMYRRGENILEPSFMEARGLVTAIESLDADEKEILLVGDDAGIFPELAGYPVYISRPDIGANMIAIAASKPAIDPTSVKASYLRNPD